MTETETPEWRAPTVAEEFTKVQKPAPATRYGPTFDEIERRDPVQWKMAENAWYTERKVRQNMVRSVLHYDRRRPNSFIYSILLYFYIILLYNTSIFHYSLFVCLSTFSPKVPSRPYSYQFCAYLFRTPWLREI